MSLSFGFFPKLKGSCEVRPLSSAKGQYYKFLLIHLTKRLYFRMESVSSFFYCLKVQVGWYYSLIDFIDREIYRKLYI